MPFSYVLELPRLGGGDHLLGDPLDLLVALADGVVLELRVDLLHLLQELAVVLDELLALLLVLDVVRLAQVDLLEVAQVAAGGPEDRRRLVKREYGYFMLQAEETA